MLYEHICHMHIYDLNIDLYIYITSIYIMKYTYVCDFIIYSILYTQKSIVIHYHKITLLLLCKYILCTLIFTPALPSLLTLIIIYYSSHIQNFINSIIISKQNHSIFETKIFMTTVLWKCVYF